MVHGITVFTARTGNKDVCRQLNDFIKVWFNGDLVHKEFSLVALGRSRRLHRFLFPVTLKQGRNVLLVCGLLRGHANECILLDLNRAPNIRC